MLNYLYDDAAIIEERNAESGYLLAHYRYADRLLSLSAGGATQYYHHDAMGSTVNLTDATGGAQVSYHLDPWGRIRSQAGSSVRRLNRPNGLDRFLDLIFMSFRRTPESSV
jgi:outer membrane protein TolC